MSDAAQRAPDREERGGFKPIILKSLCIVKWFWLLIQKIGSLAPKLHLGQSDHLQQYCRHLLMGSQQVRLQWKQSHCQSRCCQKGRSRPEEQLPQKLLNQLQKPDPESFGWKYLWQLQQKQAQKQLLTVVLRLQDAALKGCKPSLYPTPPQSPMHLKLVQLHWDQ
ncbi:MAG: hypothetical protein FRX49_02473 [Trebouxia sp. A1-2]|nr:MAG: hypothetical protein FRX49_02473 [Trebouxia sp. A1-2]